MNGGAPEVYPYAREWSVESVDIGRFLTISKNWTRSREWIQDIRESLEAGQLSESVLTIGAAGSIGRMEASPDLSDADLIIVLSDDIDLKSPEAKQAYDSVWEALSELKITRPKSDGVFSEPTNKKQLLEAIGNTNENLNLFAKRLLLLLETQPVYRDEEFTNLVAAVVDRYAHDYVEGDSKKEWALLLNDLIRYFRSLCVNYQWGFEHEAGKWPIRNIKLRHSRLIMYSGLLFLLGEASKERKNKIAWLKDQLVKTPLERLAWIYEKNTDWNFHRVGGAYDVFLSQLNISSVREALNYDPAEGHEDGESYKKRYEIPEFAALKSNSDGLIAELLRFVFARRNAWSERFFEYLIF